MKRKVKLLLDSGAFSAWRMRKPIVLRDYIDFVQRHHDHLAHFINLDVIPGTPGGSPTSHQVEEAAQAGWANFLEMRKAGLEPWPVYHIGERRYWLERMVGEGAKYIGLGGIALLDDTARLRWLDEVFDFLSADRGYPCVKLHGLGVSSTDIIHRYPWSSTDSTTWASVASMGGVMVPTVVFGEASYVTRPLIVLFTDDKMDGSASTALLKPNHFKTLPPVLREYVTDYLRANGYEPDGLNHYRDRRRLNVRFYVRCAKAHELAPFRPRSRGLFPSTTAHAGLEPVKPKRFNFYFASDRRWSMAHPLDQEKARHHLLSYYEIQRCTDLREYVETGEFPNIKRKGSRREKLRIRD